ncbi:glycosyltransferase family 2 protein [Pyxidicoccus xibeiensis]|uniref:glycosyltransferase family 2 protein n=1 Tax=Pyxidicoccus xibeiensis TaxID=2906759 RepID=UPI0020A80F46|nr:glycosyltransferase family 2 protein [Pyxidicoccus xibeiensis]MCP3138243.1 glycosyltransferase family 2 protein [Pyxidicoccus xibeiensis]
MPTVSVIIVNFNGEKLLADCLGSLARQTYRDFEVIFVDNGSVDGSLARARELMPEAHFIPLQENTGFARGNNIGIAVARGTHIVLLNNDTEAEPRFLEELVRAAESHPKAGMVAPKILNFFDRALIDSVGGLVMCADGIAQGRGRGEQDTGQYDALEEVLLPSGCAALYRKAMLDEVGLFAEDFFAYCEDSDLGLRCRWAGYGAVSAPRAVVFHKYSASSSTYSPWKLRLVERNHYLLTLRNFPAPMLALVPAWSLYRHGLMAWAFFNGRGKGQAADGNPRWALFKAFVQGHWEALRASPAHLRRSRPPRRLSPAEFWRLLRNHRISLRDMIFNA